MKLAHAITVSVFIKSQETTQHPTLEKDALHAFETFYPNLKTQKENPIKKEVADGLEGNTITIYKMIILKEGEVNTIIKHMRSQLGTEQVKILSTQKESRLDENLDFFIRLDKQSFLKGIWTLTDSGDCFHIKITLAAYPKTRESALKVAEKIFS